MAWFGENDTYDRVRILASARRAAGRGDHRKAVALYERVRELEPENADLLRRLAAQRARAGQREQGWRDCRDAARRLVQQGFVEQAIGVYRDFARFVPREVAVWEALAELEVLRQRRADAVGALLEGRRFFRSRSKRREALSLLRRARNIDPAHFEANFDLAGLLARSGARAPALRILRDLERHVRGRDLRRLRGRVFRCSPGLHSGWRWLSAYFRTS